MPPIETVLLDLEGTLWFKGAPIPGAARALSELQEMGLKLRFLTNTDSLAPRSIQRNLAAMGLHLSEAQIFTPAVAALHFLGRHPGRRCYCLVAPELAPLFAPCQSTGEPVDYVVLGDFREQVSYPALNTAFRHLMAGAELLALQKGRYFIRENGYNLDTGAFVQLLEYASGKTARVLGKPAPEFFYLALEHAGCPAGRAVIVGDDVTTDIAGARGIGATGVLVRTGKYTPEVLAAAPAQPDFVIDSVAGLPGLLRQLRTAG